MANYTRSQKTRRKQKQSIAVWARVPVKQVEQIERALPPYGWRSRLVRTVVQRVSERLAPGEAPSMERLMTLVEDAVDELFVP